MLGCGLNPCVATARSWKQEKASSVPIETSDCTDGTHLAVSSLVYCSVRIAINVHALPSFIVLY